MLLNQQIYQEGLFFRIEISDDCANFEKVSIMNGPIGICLILNQKQRETKELPTEISPQRTLLALRSEPVTFLLEYSWRQHVHWFQLVGHQTVSFWPLEGVTVVSASQS